MARQFHIDVISAQNRVIVREVDGSNQIAHIQTGLGAWWVESDDGDLSGGSPNSAIKLKTSQITLGEFKFSDVFTCEVDGTDILSTATSLNDIIEAIAPTMFSGGDAANPLPTGAATAAKQDTGNTKLDTLIASSAPIDVAITPLTTQGSSITQAITGRKMGGFQWTFTKNGGTNGLGTLYGTLDGTNYESLGTTGSQTGNASGIIRFDENWKTLKFEFTTQTGAGSTFGGTFYAS